MSEEMAEKRRKEIEEMQAEEQAILEEMKGDHCPNCKLFTSQFSYVIMFPAPFGWLECPGCGVVFSPQSIRKQKQKLGHTRPISSIIIQ